MKNDKPRVLIITDSLGCPREEISVEKTWVDMILQEFSNRAVIYTQCYHGMSSRTYYKPYIKEINPNIVITQIGLVDAVRRAQPYYVGALLSRIYGVNKIVHALTKKHHYFFTKIKENHYGSINDYTGLFNYILNNTQANVLFIPIAPPGKELVKVTYRVREDIIKWNSAIISIDNKRLSTVNPYSNEEADDYLLGDGQHLSEYGENQVYLAIKTELNNAIENWNESELIFKNS